jgi:hypothetical protein
MTQEEHLKRLHAMLYPTPTAAEQALSQTYGSGFTTVHSLLEKPCGHTTCTAS